MNSNLQPIKKYLEENGFREKTFTKLSESGKSESDRNPFIQDENVAYDFDDVTDSFYKENLHSADALLLGNDIYLIEFKPVSAESESKGFNIVSNEELKGYSPEKLIEYITKLGEHIQYLKQEYKREEIRLKLFQKMVESFLSLQHLFSRIKDFCPDAFRKHFIVVTNDPLESVTGAYLRVSELESQLPLKKESFLKYQKCYVNSKKRVCYDSVDVWGKSQFATKLEKLK